MGDVPGMVNRMPVLSTPAEAAALSGPHRLAKGQHEFIPVVGPGSPSLVAQGRLVGNDVDVDDLVSSIATIGLLHPILVEQLPDGERVLVAGERRLRAARRVIDEYPEVTTLARGIPAIVLPGPLDETDRRSWQLVENIGRVDLSDHELFRQLMFKRCALLVASLEGLGVDVPVDVQQIDDPVTRYRCLDALRDEDASGRAGAPWELVIDQLGLHISASRAQQIARAYMSVPADISAAMSAEAITVRSRLAWVKLAARYPDLARAVWEEAQDRDRCDLLPGALGVALSDPGGAKAGEAFDRAGSPPKATKGQRPLPDVADEFDAEDDNRVGGSGLRPGERGPAPVAAPKAKTFDVSPVVDEMDRLIAALSAGARLSGAQTQNVMGPLSRLVQLLGSRDG